MQNKKGILIRIGIIAACVLIGLIIAWFRGKGQETKNIFEDTEWSLTKSGDSDIYGITFTADTLNVESKNKQELCNIPAVIKYCRRIRYR